MLARSPWHALFFLGALALPACPAAHEAPDAGSTPDAPTATDAPASTTDAPATDDAACGICAAATLHWGDDGGLACTRDSSSLTPCDAFGHARVAEACDPIDIRCTNALPGCDVPGADQIALADVNAALADPDVAAAIAAAPILYGSDPRPADGTVFYVEIDGARVEVGDCATSACSDIPAGVRALETLLRALTAQELARGDCGTVFGGP